MTGFIFLPDFVEVVFKAAAGVTGPWSLAAFALAIILVILKLVNRKIPTAVWILIGLLVLGPIGISAYRAIATESIYRVRVTVIDPQKIPVDDAKVWSSLGGEPKKVQGGWEFNIPVSTKPHDGKLTIYALDEKRFLNGNTNLILGNDFNPTATIQLTKDDSAKVGGIVLDRDNKRVAGAAVSVLGYDSEAVQTGPNGGFQLPAHASVGEQVVLHVEKQGFGSVDQGHPAGDTTATIVLMRDGDQPPVGQLIPISRTPSGALLLPIWVTDKQKTGLPGIRLASTGYGSVSGPTDIGGRTQIRLAPNTKTGVWLTLQLIGPRVRPPWVMVSPWDGNLAVPELTTGSGNVVRVVLIRQGEQIAAADSAVISAIAANIVEARKAGSLTENTTAQSLQSIVSQQAEKFGYSLPKIDQLIESASKTTTDPFQRGIAKLYLRDLEGAIRDLTLATKAEAKVENRVNANYFLGLALFEDGEYNRAAAMFGVAISLRRDDLRFESGQIAAFYKAGMFKEAVSAAHFRSSSFQFGPQYSAPRFSFQFGPNDPLVQAGLRRDIADVLAGLKQNRDALSLYQSALTLQTLNSDETRKAETLQSIGSLYRRAGNLQSALTYYDAALENSRKTGNADLSIGIINKRAGAYADLGQYGEAQEALRKVQLLHSHMKASDKAMTLNSMAEIYLLQSRYGEAQNLLQQALELQPMFAASSPDLAKIKTNLGTAYFEQKQYDQAETLFRQAFSIWETAPPKHFAFFRETTDNYSRLLIETNRSDRAKEIQERFDRILTLAPIEQNFALPRPRARRPR